MGDAQDAGGISSSPPYFGGQSTKQSGGVGSFGNRSDGNSNDLVVTASACIRTSLRLALACGDSDDGGGAAKVGAAISAREAPERQVKVGGSDGPAGVET